VIAAVLAAPAVWGQSNTVVDALLAQESATLGGTAYLVLTAAGLLEESRSVDEAMSELKSRPWGFAQTAADEAVTLGSFAYFVMQVFEMKGGLMYTILPGRRYAAREFAFRGYVQGNTSPARRLTGRDVTHMLGKVLESLGQRQEDALSRAADGAPESAGRAQGAPEVAS
jgi:hypothetical protein